MLYIGEKVNETRVECVNVFDETHNKKLIQYITDKNLLMDYLTDEKYRNGARGIRNINNNDLDKYGSRIEYNGNEYIILRKPLDYTYVLKVLPQIYNDNVFNWSFNKKYKVKECTIEIGLFEFSCMYRDNGDVSIDVKYTKCDNRHRNRVTISNIELHDGTNTRILEAIEYWRVSFIQDLNITA